MKKLTLIITAAVIALSGSVSAQAEHNNGLDGLIIGAGSGALIGQALGRNTESTVVGTAVGGFIGYIIGSDMERHPVYRRVEHYEERPVVYQREHITQYNYYYQPVEKHRRYTSDCREAEILGTVNGHAKKIYGTVCKNGRDWELVSPDQPGPSWKKGSWNNGRFGGGPKPGAYPRGNKWVGHKFDRRF